MYKTCTTKSSSRRTSQQRPRCNFGGATTILRESERDEVIHDAVPLVFKACHDNAIRFPPFDGGEGSASHGMLKCLDDIASCRKCEG